MISLNQFDEIFSPLLIRAQAPITFPDRGFRDMAAELLVKKLNLEPPSDTYPWPDTTQAHNKLKYTHWIDKQLTAFFDHHPKACGIEFNSGLSTRFQRVSMQLDWPQFNWIDIDTADVAECAHLIFPQTDNHTFLCGETWWDLAHLKSVPQSTHIVIVLENVVQQGDAEKLLTWLHGLQYLAKNKNIHIRLIFDVPSTLEQAIGDILSSLNAPLSQTDENMNDGIASLTQLITKCSFNEPPAWAKSVLRWFNKLCFKSNDERTGFVLDLSAYF